jgi:hypothetical protein
VPTQHPGDWTSFDFTLSPLAKYVFESATSRLAGQKYTPFAFATRGLAGTHFAFLCEAHSVAADPINNVLKVHIFQPPYNDDTPDEPSPVIVSITCIAP